MTRDSEQIALINEFLDQNDDMLPEEEQDLPRDDVLEENPPEKKKQPFITALYEYAETFCYALVLMILLFMFIFRYVSVEGESMRETLQNEDKLIISHLAYTPKTGDIVVLKHSPKPIIKRVIAVGGQTVKIDYMSWEVYVDGVLLKELYVKREHVTMSRQIEGYVQEFTVGEGMVFVLGDNRNNSRDSRVFGEFSEQAIIGRVVYRVFPISEFGKVD